MAVHASTRRERVRQNTLQEIRSIARQLLIASGSSGVTVNAVAREMGMSGPALYRYYPSHEELVEAVTADFFLELTEVMRATRDDVAYDTPSRRLLATCRAMRSWTIAHRAEFEWMFASPTSGSRELNSTSVRYRAKQDFERVFFDQIVELWRTRPFPVPDLSELRAPLREQLRAYSAAMEGLLPPEAAHVFLSCWIRLYGLLCMEVLNQLEFYSDMESFFEECLRDLCTMLDLEYEPVPARSA
ncbi:TetR/AcrR family transcriptional regulator [Streptosporangium sp. NPDC023615]|uniref:TetR/AcrR family transcriptional regulator n=1 Tax=Streptosporangium sp. NPDC023615 TaxID=3154794 RepID=UPI003449F8FB